MQRYALALILISGFWFLAPAAARAEPLTAQTLISWCQDARAVTTGLKVMPVAQVSQIQSNATSCVGYLRGYLDSEIHIRALVPQMGPCAAVPDNARLVGIFLNLVSQPGWAALPLSDIMVEYSNQFCPVTAPRIATVVQPQTMIQTQSVPAAQTVVQTVAVPRVQIRSPYGP
jgi:hypothetical protein